MRMKLLSALLSLACSASPALADKSPTSGQAETGLQNREVKFATPTAGEEINWSSLNSGGVLNSSSTNFRLSGSVAQSVIGFSTSANFDLGIGFWYGEGLYCIARPGDANASNTYTLGDIISIVNYIFNKPGCVPTPVCWLTSLLCRGDWNGSGTVTLGDAIQGVNYIFTKPGGPWNALAVGVCCLP